MTKGNRFGRKGAISRFVHFSISGNERQALWKSISTEQLTQARAWSLTLISEAPCHRKIPCSTSAWESSETRSDIAHSSPVDRQFSYWPVGLRPSLESASQSSSATRSASEDPAAWFAAAFLQDLGGLFRKNLFCDDKASWDKRLSFLDWLIWYDFAMGEKTKRNKQYDKIDP